MIAKDFLVRAVACLSQEKYVSRAAASIQQVPSTSDRVLSSFRLAPTLSSEEIAKYGQRVEDILKWAHMTNRLNPPLSPFEFGIKAAVDNIDRELNENTCGYLAYLPRLYEETIQIYGGYTRDDFTNSCPDLSLGETYSGECTLLHSSSSLHGFKTFFRDKNKFMIECYTLKQLTGQAHDVYNVTGVVARYDVVDTLKVTVLKYVKHKKVI